MIARSGQVLTAASAGTRPVSTYLQIATSSLRARATMAIRLTRPVAVPTRSRYQRALGLMTQPQPGELDERLARAPVAGLADALLTARAAAGRWHRDWVPGPHRPPRRGGWRSGGERPSAPAQLRAPGRCLSAAATPRAWSRPPRAPVPRARCARSRPRPGAAARARGSRAAGRSPPRAGPATRGRPRSRAGPDVRGDPPRAVRSRRSPAPRTGP